ncbi:MAG TPA: transglycosylase domain-containing protein [Actinomycetota bacterium]
MATTHRATTRRVRAVDLERVRGLPDQALRVVLLIFVVAIAAGLFALALLPSVGAAGRGVQRFNDELNTIGTDIEIRYPRFPERSTIFAADGTVLATLFLDENRKIVKLRNVDQDLVDAVLAIEDARFYEHPGLDYRGIIRALVTNVGAGDIEQGASTLTQQLARNVYADVGTERTLARKIAEARVAMRMEDEYSKDQILELYLNEIYMGRSVYGVGTAAEYYFGKHVRNLELHEAAMLAGLIQAPERYSPVVDKEAALSRRNVVLDRMAELGMITPQEAAEARGRRLGLQPKNVVEKRKFPFFVDFVRREILDLENKAFDELGTTARQRQRALFQGGLQIHTTLEPKLQRAGERVSRQHLPLPEDPQNAIASVEAATGRILALVSSQEFERSQVNLATGQGGSGRQAGSAFKPFTLVTAFEQGIPPTKVYNGANGQTIPACGDYRLVNADGGGGFMDIWAATRGSVNAVFVQLAVDAGLEANVEVAHRMGIESPLGAFCSLPLGTNEVTPLEMASAYATLANGGKRCERHAIDTIEDRSGDVIVKQKRRCKQVVDPDIAALTVNLLEGVIEAGTGTAANLGTWPAFGKTGSTNNLADAWFAGCTKQICSASWVGHTKGLIPMSNVHGERVFGGTFPARIWHDFMMIAMQGKPAIDFPGVPQISWPKAQVPDVVGLTEEEAMRVLGEAGFTAQSTEVDSSEPAGTVVGQSPQGGARVPVSTTVTIQVSTGKAPRARVPDVVGMSEGQAIRALERAGFAAAVSYETTNRKNLDGIVGAQAPGAGTRAEEGATVSITVHRYEKPKPKPSPTPEPSPTA